MDFFALIEARHSIRGFDDRPIPEVDLQRLLQSADRAPTAGNLQAFEIYVVRSREMRHALRMAALDQEFIEQAPVVLVFTANPERSAARYAERGRTLYCIQDATIACTFVMLAATALGLATTWVGAFDPDAVRRATGIPQSELPVAILPVGYGNVPPRIRPRRGVRGFVHEL